MILERPDQSCILQHFQYGTKSETGGEMKIDWAYMRKGWKSCVKAREFLEAKKITITVEADARKEKIDSEMAWEKFSKAKAVSVGKGQKWTSFSLPAAARDEVLSAAIGRSGNLRAPTLKVGDSFIVGYNDDMYQEFFS